MSWFGIPFCGYSCEFSPFRGNLLAVGTGQYFGIVGNGKLHVLDISAPGERVDKTIRTFDLRNFGQPLQILHGHQLAVKRVKCHPFNETQIVSCSYDTAVNVFDMAVGQMVQHFDQHTEFTLGIDLSLFEEIQTKLSNENVIASTSWDCTACVWNLAQGPPPPAPPAIVKRMPQKPM
eukprot:g31819.t1